MKKVMISGANGFIGSALVRFLAQKNIEIFALVKDENEKLFGIDRIDNVHIIYCDLFDIGSLTELTSERDFDCFYHLAWVGVSGEHRKDVNIQLSNVSATADCVKAADELGCRKFVGVGSFMEKEAYISLSEQGLAANPAYLYGACKLSAKMMSKLTAQSLDIDFCWGVITNAYGAGDRSARFINYLLNCLIDGESVKLTACNQTYDFLYIDDVVKALYLIGEHGKDNKEYIIGSGKARPLKEFVLRALDTLDSAGRAEFGAVPFRGVSVPAEMMNTDDIYVDCGFVPEVPFDEGIRRTYEWLKSLRDQQ